MHKEALEFVQESVRKSKKQSDLDWTEIKDSAPFFDHSSDILRRYGRAWYMLEEWGLVDFSTLTLKDFETPDYKNTTEIIKDGQQKSDRLIEMSETDMKDTEFLLKAHGYNPNEWEIVNAKNSIYNVNAKGGITKTLYSSKITVKPKVSGFNIDKLIEKITKNIEPVHVEQPTEGENLLEIPLYDMHFGIADFSYYKPVMTKIMRKIRSQKWDTVMFVIGQDLLHNDGFTGQTTSGTMIDKVDMEQAWEDAYDFYTILFNTALSNAKNVDVIFSDGNHDQAMGWSLVKALSKIFLQINFDTKMKKFKAYTWNEIFIGITHGDKGQNRVQKAFLAEYGKLMSNATVRELHLGHLHHEKSQDDFGIVQRTLGSGVPTDQYHADNAFIGARKKFQIFEYSPDSLEAIYYI